MNIHDATEQAFKNGYAKGYADGKAEVAKEILELIDCALSPILVYNGYTIKEYLAKLKKKYTEGET